MRLWSFHPKYLDAKGLGALWREGLLARCVLSGASRGYRNHPQLLRFKRLSHPVEAMDAYLQIVLAESQKRGYRYDDSKIDIRAVFKEPVYVNSGQVLHEWALYKQKLSRRSPDKLQQLQPIAHPEVHPLFLEIPGPVADWEFNGQTHEK